ncbi:MAG TPA: geranyl transferase [Ruminococcaceae bacterium]|nr:geranyl transferase [Oscillospiraceae bacterium]
MNRNMASFEQELLSCLPQEEPLTRTVIEAMCYSLTAGGKRIRPLLVLSFAELCGGSAEAAMPFACAIEMIHTYSLIHDDLPCMDNDDMRRGKPTNHKVYGEAAAVLAGDALLTLAFETVLCDKAVALNGFEKCAKAGRLLSVCSGVNGMIGGQIIDIESEGRTVSSEHLEVMDRKKTGALIKASCLLGCISAGANEQQQKAAARYAECIGLAFQIVDDMLDILADEKTLGKPVGSDEKNKKSTYVSLLGLEECQKRSEALTEEAIQSLSVFPNGTEELIQLAHNLCTRKK